MEPTIEADKIKAGVLERLRQVFDPEIPVNIYDLGLVYLVEADATGLVTIRMTLTSPSCPAAESLPDQVQYMARLVEGVSDVKLEVVWEPPWTPEKMSEAAKLQLNMF